MKPAVDVAESPDGTITYAVEGMPCELPCVRAKDLEAAWDFAGEAARRLDWGRRRAFRFMCQDGRVTDLVISDPDARCWAGAVDRMVGIERFYGLSVCLRLLALIDLLGRAEWTAELVGRRGSGIRLFPTLLTIASEMRLGEDARFDEQAFAARLPLPACPSAAFSGA